MKLRPCAAILYVVGSFPVPDTPLTCSLRTTALHTLGTFTFYRDGVPVADGLTTRTRALLAYLVAHQNVDLARERLIETFWPDADSKRGRDSLNTALSLLRRALRAAGCDPRASLGATHSVVRWKARTWFDVLRLSELARTPAVGALDEALRLYRGDFLEGIYDDWAVALRESAANDFETILARALDDGDDPDIARRLIARNPYDERAYGVLIRSELASGRRSGAAVWMARYRRAMAEVEGDAGADIATFDRLTLLVRASDRRGDFAAVAQSRKVV
ncbi:MAG: hypothetical protein NVSMB19_15700 [Vulcanimicrobiaceae bacterium]